MIVVLGIIAILVGILLPAVQSVRESARRTTCINQLRQVGVALHQFHDTHRVLPHNGGWEGEQQIPRKQGGLFTPATVLKEPNYYGVGDPELAARKQLGSWLFGILPYLEQVPIYQERRWNESVPTYACASRRDAVTETVVDKDSNAEYWSGGWRFGRSDYAGNLNVMPGIRHVYPKSPVKFSDIKDGLSTTWLCGEKSFNIVSQNTGGWWWDEPFFLGGSGGTVRWSNEIYLDGPEINEQSTWGSPHNVGVNIAMADGSVASYSFATDRKKIDAMLTINGDATRNTLP